jgi:hypothetical protein
MGEPSVSFPFGVETQRWFPSFAILDKSFLDGVNPAQLQDYAQKGWTFGVPEVLMYEQLRKRDARRTANFFKLHSIENSLVRLPGIGEMFRAEAKTLKPASTVIRAKLIKLTVQRGPSGEYFELSGRAQLSTKERSAELKTKLPKAIDMWRSLGAMPELKNASPKEIPEMIKELSLKVRDDREDMRGFYGNHRHSSFPPAELVDEKWALFRWIQVQLLAGLDFIGRHGLKAKPNQEKLLHELLDLDYLIPALLVGGLACREKRFIDRFRFLRPDGVVLR